MGRGGGAVIGFLIKRFGPDEKEENAENSECITVTKPINR